MVMTSAALGRRLARDPDEDNAETCVYVKPAMPWDRLMVLQIMRDLDAPAGERVTPTPEAWRRTPAPPPPNVFLSPSGPSDPPPPWAASRRNAARESASRQRLAREQRARESAARASAARASAGRASAGRAKPLRGDETRLRPRWQHRAPRRTLLPWILFAMCFLLAFGVGQDRALRKQLAGQVRGATAEGAVMVEASAVQLWSFVSRIGM